MKKVVILGAGAMGGSLCVPLAENNHEVHLWGTAKDNEIIAALQRGEPHPRLGVKLPSKVRISSAAHPAELIRGSDIVVIAVSSNALEAILEKAAPHIGSKTVAVNVAKGLSRHARRIMTHSDFIRKLCSPRAVVVVGGPSLAGELAQHRITTAVFASKDPAALKLCRTVFGTPYYAVHTTDDVIGVELCAAVKNVYAIAVGFCTVAQACEESDRCENIRAAVFTRALLEMARLIEACSGRKETAEGLAGLGDLMVTSQGGRNEMFGQLLGRGKNPHQAIAELCEKGVVEGYDTARAFHWFVRDLQKRTGFSAARNTPLLMLIHSMLHRETSVKEGLKKILRIIS